MSFTENLRSQNIKNILIKSFPECYKAEKFKIINNAYQLLGFENIYTEKTQYFKLTGDFEDSLKAAERRYLNFAYKNNFLFKRLDLKNLSEAYNLIASARQAKGYPVTMSLKSLEKTFKQFPEHYMLFGVYDKNHLIATAVCIKVNSKILYTFYIGDDLNYRKHSPVVFLIANIHKWCNTNNYSILDLGISTEKGQMNLGLYNFKASLGTLVSNKPVYLLEL